MKILVTIILLFASGQIIFGQNVQKKYYLDETLTTEVEKNDSAFVLTITENKDSVMVYEIINLKTNEIFSLEKYKKNEPIGVWKYNSNGRIRELDYNFSVDYENHRCLDSIPTVIASTYFVDDDKVGYKAPKSESKLPIQNQLAIEIVYPSKAKLENIFGSVIVTLQIDTAGKVNNIYVVKGKHILLDKELVRAVRQLKFSTPPILNGKPESFCFTVPIRFSLR